MQVPKESALDAFMAYYYVMIHVNAYTIFSDSTAKSTISVAFSPDGETFASTHGDHTVKIICFRTGRIRATLVSML